MEIERWLLRWELTEGGLTAQPGGEAPHLDWWRDRWFLHLRP